MEESMNVDRDLCLRAMAELVQNEKRKPALRKIEREINRVTGCKKRFIKAHTKSGLHLERATKKLRWKNGTNAMILRQGKRMCRILNRALEQAPLTFEQKSKALDICAALWHSVKPVWKPQAVPLGTA